MCCAAGPGCTCGTPGCPCTQQHVLLAHFQAERSRGWAGRQAGRGWQAVVTLLCPRCRQSQVRCRRALPCPGSSTGWTRAPAWQPPRGIRRKLSGHQPPQEQRQQADGGLLGGAACLEQRALAGLPAGPRPCPQKRQAHFALLIQVRVEPHSPAASGEELDLQRRRRRPTGVYCMFLIFSGRPLHGGTPP